MAALISSNVWFLFIALTVVVVVGSPTTDLLEFVDCLLRDCVRNFTNADRNHWDCKTVRTFAYSSTREQSNKSPGTRLKKESETWRDRFFFIFSLARELSPFLLHEHVLSLLVSKLFILSLHSLCKFHVSCFVFSHFNSLPPASLSLHLHFS